MKNILLISKDASLSLKSPKSFTMENLYKYCGNKSSSGFDFIHSFQVNENTYSIYGKKKGRANNENKYELPPPIDNDLFFGTLCIVKKNSAHEHCSITIAEWEKVYEELFGGFEDIESSDGERSMDSVIYSDEEYTEEGYLKDGFVIDDNELQEEEYLPYD